MFRKKVSSLSSFIQKTFTEHLYVTDTVLEDVTKKWIGSSSKSWEAHDLVRKQTTYERLLEKYELPRMRTDLSRRNNNWADPREWDYLPYMGLPLFFRPQGTEENHQVIILTYTSVTKSFPHSTSSSPTSGAVAYAVKTWRCAGLTCLQGLSP